LWLGWRERQAKDLASPGADLLMAAQPETAAAAPVAAGGTLPKLHRLLRKRLRQLVRVTLTLVGCLALAATVLLIWRLPRLN